MKTNYRVFKKDHPCGTHIDSFVSDLISKANFYKEPVIGYFNFVELIAYPFMAPEVLISFYYGACSDSARKYWQSIPMKE